MTARFHPFARLFAALLLGAGALPAIAQVSVTEPWVRATVPAQKVTGAFMQLKAAQASRLVEVRSPVAGLVELHEMAMDGGVMKMRPVPGVALPAGTEVKLAPGGYHVMLLDLKQPLKTGDTVPLTLVVEGADRARQTIEVTAQVRPLTGGRDGQGHSHSHEPGTPPHKH